MASQILGKQDKKNNNKNKNKLQVLSYFSCRVVSIILSADQRKKGTSETARTNARSKYTKTSLLGIAWDKNISVNKRKEFIKNCLGLKIRYNGEFGFYRGCL